VFVTDKLFQDSIFQIRQGPGAKRSGVQKCDSEFVSHFIASSKFVFAKLLTLKNLMVITTRASYNQKLTYKVKISHRLIRQLVVPSKHKFILSGE
jgi:hypothetical protein